jgi:hypothetical protein
LSQQINLYNPALPRPRPAAASALLYVLVVALVIGGLAAFYEHYRLSQTRAEAAAVSAKLKDARVRSERFAAERGARKPDAAREAELVDLLARLKRRDEIIAALKSGVVGSRAGFSEFMRAFSRRIVSGVWLTGFEIDAGGKELSLSGRALGADLVPRYLEGLNLEALMQGRQFSALRIEQAPVAAAPPPQNQKDAKNAKPRPAAPRYVNFVMSTPERDDSASARSAGAGVPAPDGMSERFPATSAVIAPSNAPAPAGSAK